MAHITKKDYKLYVESYKTITKGTVTPIGEVAAWAENEKFYGEMEAWAWLIDSIIPDWFPLNYIQEGFIAIVKKVYEVQVQDRLWKAIDTGNAAWNKIEQTITWAQGEINNAVTNMKNRIESEIINPLKAQIQDAQNKIASATADLQTKLDAAKTDLQAKVDGVSRDLDNKINSANETLRNLNDRINAATANLESLRTNLLSTQSSVRTVDNKVDGNQADLSARLNAALERIKALEAGKAQEKKGGLFDIKEVLNKL